MLYGHKNIRNTRGTLWPILRGFRLHNPTIPYPDQSNVSPMNSSFSQLNTPPSLTQDTLREASLEIFRWLLANHEGKPSSEPIYKDS